MIRAIAFYLPQFHPVPENDEWWGKGFTEWTNCMRARPMFPGHHQPHFPADLGFYDLRVPEVREEQARLARDSGLHGFCYYHYWFSGRRLLERPFQEVLASGRPDFPFCLCWANENWTRRWDGGDQQILVAQTHSDPNDLAFIRDVIPAFRDPRYIRVNGRPLFLVYRTDLFPDPRHTVRIWRDECEKAGVGDPYLCRTESVVTGLDPREHGFDAAYEFPPLGMPDHCHVEVEDLFPGRRGVDPSFSGTLFPYEKVARGYLARAQPAYKLFRGNLVSWDNTARVQGRATVVIDATPERYREWLSRLVELTRETHAGDEQLIFVNAWNEWAEGCHLEPDARFGRGFLEATRLALSSSREPLRRAGDDDEPGRGRREARIAEAAARFDEAELAEKARLHAGRRLGRRLGDRVDGVVDRLTGLLRGRGRGDT